MEQEVCDVEACRRDYSLEKSSVRARRMLAGAAEIALEALRFAVHSWPAFAAHSGLSEVGKRHGTAETNLQNF